MSPTPSPTLFQGVCYWLSPTLTADVRQQLTELLRTSGATACPKKPEAGSPSRSQRSPSDAPADSVQSLALHKLTHIITDCHHLNQRHLDLPEQVELVTPHWVTRSFDLQLRQEPRFYSPHPDLLLSGLCIATTNLPPRDAEWIWNIVQLLGGQFREALTKEVTHLLCGREDGPKWQMASTHGKGLGMHIVLPQWLYDSFQTRTLQSTRVYAWPNPPLYTFASGSLPTSRPDRSHASTSSENLPKTKTHQILGGFEPRPSFIDQLPPDHPSLVKLLHIGAVPNQSDGQQDGPTSDIVPDFLQQSTSADVSKPFQGLKFYIASDAKVSSNISVAIAKRLETSGAASVFVAPDKVRSKAKKTFTEAEVSGAYLPEWEDKIKEADFVVCSERSGWEYWLASDLGKCVGTLFWLLTVIVTGKLDDPLHYIFHYPHPPSPVEGFETVQMTITNYTSTKRELLKRLVELMGGNITGDMGRNTKFVVAARKDGKKVDSAVKWHIPVINHKWLYECWIQWSFVDPVNYEPGRLFPPGLNFQETMMSDMPENAVSTWANSEGARKNKAKSLLFLTLAREQQQQQSDVGGSDGAMDMDHSATQSTAKPPASTPGMIEDELLPNKSSATSSRKDKKSPGKPKPRPSAGAGEAEQVPSSVPRSTTHQRPPPGSSAADPDLPSSTSKRKASVLGAEKSKASALDMNKHEKEKRRRTSPEEEEDDEDQPAPRPPTSASKGKGKGKKAAPEPEPEPEPEAEPEEEELNDDDVPLPPAGSYSSYRTGAKPKTGSTARKTVDGKVPKKSSASTARKTVQPTPSARKLSASNSQPEPASADEEDQDRIRYIQTGHHMSEDLIKKFAAIGGEKTDDPSICTHVIADRIQRTTKFLHALPRGPEVVTEAWVKACVRKGNIQSTRGYQLEDPEGEVKWSMRLSDTLRRARRGEPLFQNKQFWVTTHTTPPPAVLKSLISANGGQVMTNKPTMANIFPDSTDKVVVSSEEDRKIWDPLIHADKSFPIFTGEHIILSVLRQSFESVQS